MLTFWGVRQIEQDESVPDDKKVEAWESFIQRASEQIAYARKAAQFWKSAGRRRIFETAAQMDGDVERSPQEKIEGWRAVSRLYTSGAEARTAAKRVLYWTHEETKRRVDEAEAVESARRSKVDRIAAWNKVLRWSKKGPEARAAQKRIDTLQGQLYKEAQSADRVARLPATTKLSLWREVLKGRPPPAQRRLAEQRVRALEGIVGRTSGADSSAENAPVED